MSGTPDPKPTTAQTAPPSVVVVGAASRDLTDDDPRGWRLGGAATYGALALARLGVRTVALIGLDPEARSAHELDLLRSAGVGLVPVPLAHGPVFVNEETPSGRVQTAVEVSDPMPIESIPMAWLAAPGWLFAPVAGELPEACAHLPAPDATVAVGWQGLLRTLLAGQAVMPRAPWPSALLARADLIGASVDDLPPAWPFAALDAMTRPGAELLLTAGQRGGVLIRLPMSNRNVIRYGAVPAAAAVDPTGAGDVTLATLLATRMAAAVQGAATAWSPSRRRHVLLAAAAASLTVGRPGVDGVPDLAALRESLAARGPQP